MWGGHLHEEVAQRKCKCRGGSGVGIREGRQYQWMQKIRGYGGVKKKHKNRRGTIIMHHQLQSSLKFSSLHAGWCSFGYPLIPFPPPPPPTFKSNLPPITTTRLFDAPPSSHHSDPSLSPITSIYLSMPTFTSLHSSHNLLHPFLTDLIHFSIMITNQLKLPVLYYNHIRT